MHIWHLCQTFLGFTLGCTSSILHRALHPDRFQSTHNGVLGWHFKALPSHSTYQSVSSTNQNFHVLLLVPVFVCSFLQFYIQERVAPSWINAISCSGTPFSMSLFFISSYTLKVPSPFGVDKSQKINCADFCSLVFSHIL